MNDNLTTVDRLIEAEVAYRAASAKADAALRAWLELVSARDTAANVRDDARAAVSGYIENLTTTVWAVTRGIVALPVREIADVG